MNPGDNDILEQDLARTEVAYRQSGLDEPPAMLDQAVLNSARRAIETMPSRPWSFGWMHATATTALVVLGLTVVLQQRGELDNVPTDLDKLAPAKQDAPVSAISNSAQFRETVEQEAFTTPEEQRASVAKSAAETVSERPDAGQLGRQIMSDMRLENPLEAPAVVTPVAEPGDESVSADDEPGARNREAVIAEGLSRDDLMDHGAKDHAATEPVTQGQGNEADLAGQDHAFPPPATPASGMAAGNMAMKRSISQPHESKDKSAGDLSLAAQYGKLETGVDPETWLNGIRALKANEPDGPWQDELRAFRELFPDFPVPEDLLSPVTEAAKPE